MCACHLHAPICLLHIESVDKELVAIEAEDPDVVYEEEQMSYGCLNRRANGLGRKLREMGVGAEVRVGIWMERSLEMVVGMVGVLKAGGAYVPMDLSNPGERVRGMLEEAEVGVVVTQEKVKGELPASWAQIVSVDGEGGEWEEERWEEMEEGVGGGKLAYIMYTSGTSGIPKGVELTFNNLQSDVDASIEAAALQHKHKFLGIIPLFHATGDFKYRSQWQEGVKSIEGLTHFLPRVGMRCRRISDNGEETIYASSYFFSPEKIMFSETDEDKKSASYFTLEKITESRTRLTVDYYIRGNAMNEFLFKIFKKQKMKRKLERSLENLDPVAKSIKLPKQA